MKNLNIKGKLREMFTMQKDLNENILKEFFKKLRKNKK